MKKFTAIASLAALALFVATGADAAMIGSVGLNVNPVNQGQSVVVSGNCGSPGANGTVAIAVSSGASTQNVSTTANASGNFSASVALPSNFPIGVGSVVATCPNGDTVTGSLTVNSSIGTSLTLSTTPVLGQNLTVSGSCGSSVSSGSTVIINLMRNGTTVGLGSTTTTGGNGNFSSTVTVPANAGGGPVVVQAVCPNGTIAVNTAVIDPFAVVANAGLPTIGSAFTVTGVCGNAAGGEVTIALVSGSTNANLGTTTTTGNGSFSAVVSVPSGFPTGAATLFAMCPTGIVSTASVVVNPGSSGGTVVLPPSSPSTPATGGTAGSVSNRPSGGVAAGKTDNVLGFWALALALLGAAGYALSKRSAHSNVA
jgi:hypothetical protein